MKSVKLNSDMRNRIVNKLLERGFAKREQELSKRQGRLLEETYKQFYDRSLSRMEQLPEGWLRETTRFFILLTAGQSRYINLGETKRVLNKHGDTLKPDALLSKEWLELWEEEKDLRIEKRNRAHSTRAVLESCSTSKQLVEAWPEIEQIVKDVLPADKSKLPVANKREMNEVFDLPPKEVRNGTA